MKKSQLLLQLWGLVPRSNDQLMASKQSVGEDQSEGGGGDLAAPRAPHSHGKAAVGPTEVG